LKKKKKAKKPKEYKEEPAKKNDVKGTEIKNGDDENKEKNVLALLFHFAFTSSLTDIMF